MRLALRLLPLLAFAAAGCGGDAASGDGRLSVVATTTQAADFARNVAGERAEVRAMLRPGADPHDYEPRPSDVAAIAEAGLVVRSGGEVDDWLGDVLENAGEDATPVALIESV